MIGGLSRARTIGALLAGLLLAVGGCRQRNASHCGNQQGNLTCQQRDPEAPYCNVCEAFNDGCLEERTNEPGCDLGTSGGDDTTTSSSSDESSSGSSTEAVDSSSSTGEPNLCGNGMIDEGEICDGMMLPEGITCMTKSKDFGEGMPGCTADCLALDYTMCPLYMLCGNREVGFGEECDGEVFGGGIGSCDDFPNLTGDGLTCDDDCMFDTSACMMCREHDQPCDPMADVCCDEGDVCGGALAAKHCCTEGTGDCLL